MTVLSGLLQPKGPLFTASFQDTAISCENSGHRVGLIGKTPAKHFIGIMMRSFHTIPNMSNKVRNAQHHCETIPMSNLQTQSTPFLLSSPDMDPSQSPQ
jgi:hypothetical protein